MKNRKYKHVAEHKSFIRSIKDKRNRDFINWLQERFNKSLK